MPLFTDAPKAREPGSFSSHQRFHAFAHIRDLPQAERSIRAAYNQHQTRCLGKSGERGASGRSELWSREDHWPRRLELWDAEVDRQHREKFLKTQLDAVERHQRLTAASLNVATVPIRAMLNRLSDPAFLASVESVPAWSLLRDSLRAVQILPALINAERQALGLSQMEVAVDDRREHAWADRIATDPKATHLAVELLHQLARGDEGPGSVPERAATD